MQSWLELTIYELSEISAGLGVEPLYRAVDRAGDTVDFLLTAKRDRAAARRFLERAINLHDVPEKITIDKSGANTAPIESVKADACVDILMRQCKYLNNIVEQDHRAIKRITRPMLGFKSFWSAASCAPNRLEPRIHRGTFRPLPGTARTR